MAIFARNAAHRSFAFLGTFMDALEKAVTMAQAVHHDSVNADDIKKVRAIAATI